jgi:ribose 5-phosphate isomerase RpiB
LAQAVSTGTVMLVVMLVQVGAGVGQAAKAGPDINAAVAAVSINARLFKANPSLFLD